jgi:RimJ/RimL family protein N-acetyltransferase
LSALTFNTAAPVKNSVYFIVEHCGKPNKRPRDASGFKDKMDEGAEFMINDTSMIIDNLESVKFRAAQRADLDFIAELESAPENAAFIQPWSIQKHELSLNNPDIRYFIIEAVPDNSPVGYIILAGLCSPHDNLELTRIVISRKGGGYGTAAFRLLKKWTFENVGANRLWLDVKTHNERAIYLYKKMGFTLEGTLRDCIKSGDTYESLHIMSLLRSEYD